MAILRTCSCGAEFNTSASTYEWLCPECDGTNAKKRAEAERWAALTPDQKIEELKARIEVLERRSQWDGRIG